MKKVLLGCVACLMIWLVAAPAIAQSTQGTFVMEITEVSSDNQQAAAQLEMMKGTRINIHYKDKQSLTHMNMMGGMVETNVKTSENGDMDMLVSAMGNKMWVHATKAEMTKSKVEYGDPLGDLDISYDESDTKEIGGFDCYKMIATTPDEEFRIEAYITEDIKINAAMIQNVDLADFRGTPLEYSIHAKSPQLGGSMVMAYKLIEFQNEVDESIFVLNTDGYTEMSWDEFMSGIGGAWGF